MTELGWGVSRADTDRTINLLTSQTCILTGPTPEKSAENLVLDFTFHFWLEVLPIMELVLAEN